MFGTRLENGLVRQHSRNWEVKKENQDDQGRTGWTSSNETSRVDLIWEEAKILANDKAEWHRRVWPNAAIWMRDELRSNSPRNR